MDILTSATIPLYPERLAVLSRILDWAPNEDTMQFLQSVNGGEVTNDVGIPALAHDDWVPRLSRFHDLNAPDSEALWEVRYSRRLPFCDDDVNDVFALDLDSGEIVHVENIKETVRCGHTLWPDRHLDPRREGVADSQRSPSLHA